MTGTGKNVIEDKFSRANQRGWGYTTNNAGAPRARWGMDADGSKAFVTISNHTGSFGYPGATTFVGIASAGTTSYNGGDMLVELKVSAIGHAIPSAVQNACPDKSCFYGAWLHTSQKRLELRKRLHNSTLLLAAAPVSVRANTFYWLRLDVSRGAGKDTVNARIWPAGAREPSSWMVTAIDRQPLPPNLVGAGGMWDSAGRGESISYACSAYVSTGLARPCT